MSYLFGLVSRPFSSCQSRIRTFPFPLNILPSPPLTVTVTSMFGIMMTLMLANKQTSFPRSPNKLLLLCASLGNTWKCRVNFYVILLLLLLSIANYNLSLPLCHVMPLSLVIMTYQKYLDPEKKGNANWADFLSVLLVTVFHHEKKVWTLDSLIFPSFSFPHNQLCPFPYSSFFSVSPFGPGARS